MNRLPRITSGWRVTPAPDGRGRPELQAGHAVEGAESALARRSC